MALLVQGLEQQQVQLQSPGQPQEHPRGNQVRFRFLRTLVIGTLALLLFGVFPLFQFRNVYERTRRLRVVELGKLYRSGQMTAEGFRETVERYGIRTIINLQDDNVDPLLSNDLSQRVWGLLGARQPRIRESELCRELGVRYVALAPDLVSRLEVGRRQPRVIGEFLALLDDPQVYPVLLHCKAGLHRTGVLSAVYRMEYQGWSRNSAFQEMRNLGFGTFACTSANDYVQQYVFEYEPRVSVATDTGLQSPRGKSRESPRTSADRFRAN